MVDVDVADLSFQKVELSMSKYNETRIEFIFVSNRSVSNTGCRLFPLYKVHLNFTMFCVEGAVDGVKGAYKVNV